MLNFIKNLFGIGKKEEDNVPNYLNGKKEKSAPKKKRTYTRKKKTTTRKAK